MVGIMLRIVLFLGMAALAGLACGGPLPKSLDQPDLAARDPSLRAAQLDMLGQINAARQDAGVEPVLLGQNPAAQSHAEAGLAGCLGSSHWNLEGLTPDMRYALTGGQQVIAENVVATGHCVAGVEGAAALGGIRRHIPNIMTGFLDSPGHRRAILNPHAHRVSLGLAHDEYDGYVVQLFERDYIEFTRVPQIDQAGVLSLAGHTRNGAGFSSPGDMVVHVYYERPPRPLTRGQIFRVYSPELGEQVLGVVRPPVPEGMAAPEQATINVSLPCLHPADVPASAPSPSSFEEGKQLMLDGQAVCLARREWRPSVSVPYLTAAEWLADGQDFALVLDLGDALVGPGVYMVVMWATLPDGEAVTVAAYPVFYQVDSDPKTVRDGRE